MSLEKEWDAYPVLRFDLSGTKHLAPSQVVMELERIMAPMEVLYGSNPKETTLGTIKDYDRRDTAYTLSIPNREVRIGYTRGLLPVYGNLSFT